MFRLLLLLLFAAGTVAVRPVLAQRQMEFLDRGLVAVRATSGDVFLSWRLLGTEPPDIGFNLYRSTGGGAATQLNATPLLRGINFTDTTANLAQSQTYVVRAVLAGVEQESSAAFTLPANAPVQSFLSIPLDRPAGGVTPTGENYTYNANDASVGDLDGDGRYEIVLKWDPSNSKDNSQDGVTGEVYLDAYTLDGVRLWRINLGRNVRAGAHYTQFLVYDFDGDNRAEVACRTADGTVDGVGNVIGDANADYRDITPNPVTGRIGHVLRGPEFLTIFDGQTGAALASAGYLPPRVSGTDFPTPAQIGAVWGDNWGNRIDRFLAAVAYLDGERPSLVMCRGYYTRSVLAAWDWRNGQLTSRWVFDSDDGTPGNAAYRGQGNHNLSVADVDADGRDEIIYGAAVIDDDGRGLFSTDLRHGDALHVSDLDPARPGLEVWGIHENENAANRPGVALYDARTGTVFWTGDQSQDVGRGVAADLDPRYPGAEMWGGSGGLRKTDGARISNPPSSQNFVVWWDGDLLRELLDGNFIDKWNWNAGTSTRLLTAVGCVSNNGTKATPALSADLLGDWREEVIWRTSDNNELRIFTTTIPTEHRIPTLMHDPQYRLAIAWQNVAYNQPPHPSYFLGEGMIQPPVPDIIAVGAPAATGSRIVNLSVRTLGTVGNQTMILGFVVGGSGTQQLLVRGVGPTLVDYDVDNPMADPRLDLYERVPALGGGADEIWLEGNDDWVNTPNSSAIHAAAVALGTFTLPNSNKDAALLRTMPNGVFTAHVLPVNGAPGIALAELYAMESTGTARLVNASARAQVAPGEQTLIVGFVIQGEGAKTILLRGIGPGMIPHGVDADAVLADPELTLFRLEDDATWKPIATNHDWSWTSGASLETFTRLGAFDVEVASTDAALFLRLSPGTYTAHVTGRGATNGVALIELYEDE